MQQRQPASDVPSGRSGGVRGNEFLTSATAAVLIVLLAAEGVTILLLGDLLSAHMFIGMWLIPPLLVKLGSTGYRFARYYLGSRPYREKGPPFWALRLLAPVLVAATVVVFATGVVLLVIGHRSGTVLLLHKVSFVVWGACFAVHLLAYLPRAARSLRADWGPRRRERLLGSWMRLALVLSSIGAGLVLALVLLSPIVGWHRGAPG